MYELCMNYELCLELCMNMCHISSGHFLQTSYIWVIILSVTIFCSVLK